MKEIVLFVAMIALAGCASIELKPEASRVRVMQSEPKGCKYLGEVTGSQGNAFTGDFTSNENMETGARNDLKNKAFDLGGNVVSIITNRAGQTASYGQYGGGSSQTNVTLSGTVFSCPDVALQ